VLLVDDEASLREPLAKHLRQEYGYQVDTATSSEEVLIQLEQNQSRYEVVLMDESLPLVPSQKPEPLGVTLTTKIKTRYPDIEIIIFSDEKMTSGLEALRAGAYRYLAKPFNLEELGMLIQMAAEQSRLKEIAREKQILEQLMETSTALISGQSLPEVLDTILRGVQAIGFDRVGLYLLSDGNRGRICGACTSPCDRYLNANLTHRSPPTHI
jgi:DNA-binding NtrC family response regulator